MRELFSRPPSNSNLGPVDEFGHHYTSNDENSVGGGDDECSVGPGEPDTPTYLTEHNFHAHVNNGSNSNVGTPSGHRNSGRSSGANSPNKAHNSGANSPNSKSSTATGGGFGASGEILFVYVFIYFVLV